MVSDASGHWETIEKSMCVYGCLHVYVRYLWRPEESSRSPVSCLMGMLGSKPVPSTRVASAHDCLALQPYAASNFRQTLSLRCYWWKHALIFHKNRICHPSCSRDWSGRIIRPAWATEWVQGQSDDVSKQNTGKRSGALHLLSMLEALCLSTSPKSKNK